MIGLILRKPAFYLAICGFMLIFYVVQLLNRPAPPIAQPLPPPANPYSQALSATGLIEAKSENIELGVPVAALVNTIKVEVGQEVRPGQALLELDNRDLVARLPILDATIAARVATLTKEEDQLKRLESVSDPRAVSADQTTRQRNAVAEARAQVQVARAQRDEVKILIDRMTVRAPKGGTILQLNVRPGEFVTPGMQPAPIVLGDIKDLRIRAEFDEQQASRFNPTLPATATLKNNNQVVIPLHFVRVEPLVVPKRSLTGQSTERVDTRVLQVIYEFGSQPAVPVYVGQQVDVFVQAPESRTQPTADVVPSSLTPEAIIPPAEGTELPMPQQEQETPAQ